MLRRSTREEKSPIEHPSPPLPEAVAVAALDILLQTFLEELFLDAVIGFTVNVPPGATQGNSMRHGCCVSPGPLLIATLSLHFQNPMVLELGELSAAWYRSGSELLPVLLSKQLVLSPFKVFMKYFYPSR
jgi:hypothetical protein